MKSVVLQSLPWWTDLQFEFYRTFSTTERYYLTALALGVFGLLMAIAYFSGKLLKRRVRSDAVQAIQGVFVTVGSIVLSGLLVVVWGLTGTVVQSGSPVVLDSGDETRSVETSESVRLGEEVTVRGVERDGRIDADEIF